QKPTNPMSLSAHRLRSLQDPEQESGQQVLGYLDQDGWQALGHLGMADQLLVASPDDRSPTPCCRA
ncbi:MAG: hypothetical protein PVH07_06965, partial [Chloroflexota bacterium]